jgi:hypothetical protein
MEIVPIELFGVHVDVPFAAPQAYQTARLEEFASKLCDQKHGLPLRPDQIRLRRFDELFDFEMKANFFGDNGTLIRNAERVKLGVRNARTQGDWNVIQQSLTRFYTLMDFDDKTLTHLSSHVHGKFESLESRDQWLGQFSHNALIDKPAALGYVRIPDWEKDIGVRIEPSNVVPNAVFVAWDTQFTNRQEWDSFLGSLPSVMENSANYFELGFEPFKERV